MSINGELCVECGLDEFNHRRNSDGKPRTIDGKTACAEFSSRFPGRELLEAALVAYLRCEKTAIKIITASSDDELINVTLQIKVGKDPKIWIGEQLQGSYVSSELQLLFDKSRAESE